MVEPAPEREVAARIVVYDLAPGSAPVLHRPPPGIKAEVHDAATPPERLLKPGIYLLHESERSIPLAEVDVVPGEGATLYFLSSREDASDVLRTVGGDPASLETILAAGPDPKTP